MKMINKSPPIHEEILSILKKRADAPYEYINPNFLVSIVEAIYTYYEIEDEDVDKWIEGMFSA